jgi:subtilisin family serine protease
MTADAIAWSTVGHGAPGILPARWPTSPSREWAWGGSSGHGVRVCVVDSGIEHGHPSVGAVQGSVTVEAREDARSRVVRDEVGDVSGHGTACASVIRHLAPDCALHSIRVLGTDSTGTADALLTGLAWAIEQRFDVINLSMSSRKRDAAPLLHDLADAAYFHRTMLVCSAHNAAVESYPWRFASVISVGAHETEDPYEFLANPRPPVEFFARGTDVEVGWLDGSTITGTGNSFATAHLSGLCAKILAKHPGLAPYELKSLLYLTATNVEEGVA